MKNSNNPEAKARKRKIALANLEKKYPTLLPFKGKSDYADKRIKQVEYEIATLKARIIH